MDLNSSLFPSAFEFSVTNRMARPPGGSASGPASSGSSTAPKKSKRRGGYKCGICGKPKKGHVCTGAGPSYTLKESDSTQITSNRIEQLKQRVAELKARHAQLKIENAGLREELASLDNV